ncbi:MAG: C-GCAxxG-C-C family protein [Eubacterium sp.]
MKKSEIAKAKFEEGYNCAQAVAMAYAREMNMDPLTVAGLVSGFGGGMGRMREVCGAVSGMTFVVSALYGYQNPRDNEKKAQLYSEVQQVANEFRNINGSIVCRELLGLAEKGAQPPTPEARTTEYYQKRPCSQLVEIAADILEKFISEKEK